MNTIEDAFDQRGYVVVDDIFEEGEVAHFVAEIDRAGGGRTGKWTVNDGVVQNEAFWDLVTHERLLGVVRDLFGGQPMKFCQHNDLQFGSSSFAWHRDSINRVYDPQLPDWREDDAPYQLVRCGVYLQPASSGFTFGVVPGSHKPSGCLDRATFDDNEKHLSILASLKSKAGGRDVLQERAEWIRTRPGQVVFFDPRLIHTGGAFEGRKYSLFVAYGVDNRHFREHYAYYRHMRHDLQYRDIPAGLKTQLLEKDLYVDELPYVSELPGAFVPHRALALAFRLFNNDG